MKYEFVCSHQCGTYEVSEEEFNKFLGKRLEKKLRPRLAAGEKTGEIIGAQLNFFHGCPTCRERGFNAGRVQVIKPKHFVHKN